MKFKAINPDAGTVKDLESIYKQIEERFALAAHPPPRELIGDILLALSTRHPALASEDDTAENEGTAHYLHMFRHLTRGRRWRHLVNRIGYRKPKNPAANEARNDLLAFVTETLCSYLMHLAIVPAQPALDARLADPDQKPDIQDTAAAKQEKAGESDGQVTDVTRTVEEVCPGCGIRYDLGPDYWDRNVECTQCNRKFYVAAPQVAPQVAQAAGDKSVAESGGAASGEFSADPAQPGEVVLPQDPEALLELTAEKYNEQADQFRDGSCCLVTDYPLVMVELARRVAGLRFIAGAVDAPLVLACLDEHWDSRSYKPRQLDIVVRLGEEDEQLPGDYFGIRGVTKKIREDQIPKVLMTEMAPYTLGESARLMTLDKLYNRGPACWENHDTIRRDAEHRVLLLFAIGVQDRTRNNSSGNGKNGHNGNGNGPGRADILGKKLAFHLLVSAGLKVPHEGIKTDVAWFERRGDGWLGSSFPLSALTVTRNEDDAWRNVVEADQVLPYFFIPAVAAIKPTHKPDVATHRGHPAGYLASALAGGLYHAVFLVVVAPEEETALCLPHASLILPRFDRETPTVLLATVKEGEAVLHGEAFRDLLSAHLAPLPLEVAEGPELVRTFMTMIIGELEQKHVLPTV